MFSVYHFSGTPYQIGYKHGSLLKENIQKSRKIYRGVFGDVSSVFWDKVNQYKTYISETSPAIFEEMKGISDGSGIELDKIIALNARSEFTPNDIINFIHKDDHNECTTLYTTHPHILSQNRDFRKTIGDLCFIGIIDLGETQILQIMEPGIVGKIGINNHGISVSLNFLDGIKNQIGMPIHCVLRLVLEQKDWLGVEEVINKFTTGKTGSITISSPEHCICVEYFDDDVFVVSKDKKYFNRTNHYLHPEIVETYDDYRNTMHSKLYDSSNKRYELSKDILSHSECSLQLHKDILSDCSQDSLSICRLIPSPGGIISICSIIFEPEKRKMHIRDLRSGKLEDWQEFVI